MAAQAIQPLSEAFFGVFWRFARPFVSLLALLLHLLLNEHVKGEKQRPDAEVERIQQRHIAADERPFCPTVLVR